MNPAILTAIDGVLEWAMGSSDNPAVRELRAQRDAAVSTQEAILDRVAHLSPRQREVAVMLAKGYANKEIASVLGVSCRTVEVMRAAAYVRLEVVTVSQLAVLLYRAGLLGDGEG